MSDVPSFLLNALQFHGPRSEGIREVADSEWKRVLSSWRTARLLLPLRQRYGESLPDWVRQEIDTYQADNDLRFARIKAAYTTAAQALKDAQVEHLVLKGFSLWPGYVDHPRFRQQSDIDLYCPPESLFRAWDALAAIGYRPKRRTEHLPADHVCVMTPQTSWVWRGYMFDPEIPIAFELHCCWWDEPLMQFAPLGLDQFWPRRIVRGLDEIVFPALDPVDNLAYTALDILYERLQGVPTPEQVYGLARFLDTSVDDGTFWSRWQDLHHKSLRRLEVISFRLAAEAFGCLLPDQVREQMDGSSRALNAWFRYVSKSPFSTRFYRGKDGAWLHVQFLDSFRAKCSVLLRSLLSIPRSMPTRASVFGQSDNTSQNAQAGEAQLRPLGSPLLGWCSKSIKYAGWCLYRAATRIAKLPFFLWRGLRYALSIREWSP